MNFKVYEFYLDFMNKGFTFVKSSGLDISINEAEFSDCLAIINFVRDQFKAVSRALGISFSFIYIYLFNVHFNY